MKAKHLRFAVPLIMSLFLTTMIQAQDWQWGQQFSGDGDVEPVDMVTNANDQVLVVGTFTGTTLTIGTDTYFNQGDWDIFLACYQMDGSYLWSQQMAGNGRDAVSGMAVDPDGNVFIVGSFRDEAIYFTENDSLENSDNYDTFLAVYDNDGNFLLSFRPFWGSDTERLRDIVIDHANNQMAVIGNYKTELIYFNGTSDQIVPAVGPKDQFIATLDLDGNITQLATFEVTQQQTTFKQIALNAFGGYYIGGDLRERINLTDTRFLLGDAVNMDVMVLGFDDDLNYQWGRLGKGPGYDHVNSATSDEYGNFYITGKTESSPITFDSTETMEAVPISGFGSSDMYIAKYSSSGILQWGRRKGNSGDDNAYGLAYYNDVVQFAGNYAGQVIFNQDTLDSGSLSNINTGFAKFDLDGNEIGAQEISGTLEDRARGISFDSHGETYITGFFASPILEAGSIDLVNPASPALDGFLFKYEYPFSVVFSEVKYPSCTGENDGELVATPYFGVTPYSFSWSHDPSLTMAIASGLSAGEYTVTVTDANGQSVSKTIILNEISSISISGIISDVACYNGNDGAIDITISGGTGSKTILWTTPQGSGLEPAMEDQSGLTAGTYNILVTDENGCTGTASFDVMQPTPISFSGSEVVDIVYPDGGNGAINLMVSGGTPDYAFTWTGPEGYTSNEQDIEMLINEGLYSVLVLDANACEADTAFSVLSNSTEFIVFISNIINVSCFGGSDGGATVTVIGAQGSLHYEWKDSDGQDIGEDSPSITGLAAGEYSVTVYDYRKCHMEVGFTIDEPEPLTAVIEGRDVTCFGAQNGIADLSVTGGVSPYTYAWSTGAISEDIVGLAPGTYAVEITDANGCTESADVTISEPEMLQSEIIIETQLVCYDNRDAVVSVVVTGGTEPYRYLWNDPASQTTPTAINLGVGTYTVMVTDANGCVNIGTVEIQSPPPISISFTHTDITCFGGNDGAVDAMVEGGSPPYDYEWSNGGMGSSMNNIVAGTYTLIITDLNACQKSESIEILQPDELLVSSSNVVDITCFGEQNGEINITGSGGTEPLVYTLSPGDIANETGIFNNLGSGNYSITLNDAANCGPVLMDNLIISEPEAIVMDSMKVTDESDTGANDGAIMIYASGGTVPLTYTLNPGAVENQTGEFTNLLSGTYTVDINDANNCGPVSSGDIYIGNVDIGDVEETMIASVYPNPTEGLIRVVIEGAMDEVVSLEIISMNGKMIYREEVTTSFRNYVLREVDISDQPKGIYLLKIRGNTAYQSEKIILK